MTGWAIYGHSKPGLALGAKQNVWDSPSARSAAEKRHLRCQFCSDRLQGALLIITISAGSLFSSHYRGIKKRGDGVLRFSGSSSPLGPVESIHLSGFIVLFTVSLLCNNLLLHNDTRNVVPLRVIEESTPLRLQMPLQCRRYSDVPIHSVLESRH